MSMTSDPQDPRLTRGADEEIVPQAKAYLVLSEEERAKGFIRPVLRSYSHEVCGHITTMAKDIAETYGRRPDFYGATYCAHCQMHRPVGENGEFVWVVAGRVSTMKVGT